MNKLKHAFVSAKSDGADATLVRPSNWNADHRIGIELTNRTGGALASGDVVVYSPSNDESVILGDISGSLANFVVAMEAISDTAVGLFASTGAWTVKVDGAVTRGNYLIKSATTKALHDSGIAATASTPFPGTVGQALTSIGGAGTVVAWIVGGNTYPGVGYKSADVASASNITVLPYASYIHITGTTNITAISSVNPGVIIAMEFDAALTIVHSSALLLQGSVNYTTAAGDVLFFVSEGSGNWRQIAPKHDVLNTLTAGAVFVGASPSGSGLVNLSNNLAVAWRNATNSGDVSGIYIDNGNDLVLGGSGTRYTRSGVPLRLDVDAAARLILPVGANKYAT